MISIDKNVWRILNTVSTANTIKIFFYIALNQPDEGITGFRITKIQLAIDLNLKKAMIFRSLKWLKDKMLIQELKMAADFDFMANPYYVMNNSDQKERIAEWSRRQKLDMERENRLFKEKQRKELRKAKNQEKSLTKTS